MTEAEVRVSGTVSEEMQAASASKKSEEMGPLPQGPAGT